MGDQREVIEVIGHGPGIRELVLGRRDLEVGIDLGVSHDGAFPVRAVLLKGDRPYSGRYSMIGLSVITTPAACVPALRTTPSIPMAVSIKSRI